MECQRACLANIDIIDADVDWCEPVSKVMESLADYLADEPQEQRCQPKKPNPSTPRLYIGIDGTFVPTLAASSHMEAKVGIIFTEQRAEINASRHLLLNKQYTGTYESVERFSKGLFACALEMGANDETELIILGDGAPWITNLALSQYPTATLILDWWHLKERVWDTVSYEKQRIFTDEQQATQWGKELIALLWRGRVEAALQHIRSLSNSRRIDLTVDKDKSKWGSASLAALFNYIRHNLHSIVDYHNYRRNEYFISSVFAEKAIDILVCRRQKLRGQNWSRDGAEDVIQLRQLILNDQWDSHWLKRAA